MKKLKVAINGFGRIGRAIFRAGYKDIDFIVINDIGKPETLVYLLKYDSVYGKFPDEIEFKEENNLLANEKEIKISNNPNFLQSKLYFDIIVEATGKQNYRSLPKTQMAKILVTYPIERLPTCIYGINHEKGGDGKIISLGSCTANVSIPVLYLLDKERGIKKAFITPLNSYIAQQRLVDSAHNELRASRAAPINIIPRETSAVKITRQVLPNLETKVEGMGIKLPTPCGSLMEFVIQFNKEITKENIDEVIENSEIPYLKLTKEPLVLSDVVGSPFLLYDSELTKVINDIAQLFVWYDNEYGYACRVVDMLKFLENKNEQ